MRIHCSVMRLLLLIIAQAIPWYLFPGAAPKDTSKAPKAKEPVETVVSMEEPDTLIRRTGIPEVLEMTFALPMGNPGNVDFYCGALLAARELGNDGLKINISAYDLSKCEVTEGMLERSDVFIGPIDCQDIRKVTAVCPRDRMIISPLDPKASALTETCNVIQTPVNTDEHLRDLTDWAVEGMNYNDKLVVVLETEADTSGVILDELDYLGVSYYITYGYMSVASACAPTGRTIFLTGSDKEYFVSGVIRCVSVLALQQHDVSVFCPSKARSYDNLNVELMHNANVHMSSTYFIDYDSPAVKSFVYAYRAVFRAEPNSYSFHGYDTMKYFANLLSTYGYEWPERITEYPWTGLQTGFKFKKRGKGAENCASRRIVYSPDYSITVQ